MGLSSIFQGFIEDTEFHGIRQIFKPDVKLLSRLFWFLLFFTSLIYCITYAAMVMKDFFAYDVTMRTSIEKSTSIILPNTAICSSPIVPEIDSDGDVWIGMTQEDFIFITSEAFAMDYLIRNNKQKSIYFNKTKLTMWSVALNETYERYKFYNVTVLNDARHTRECAPFNLPHPLESVGSRKEWCIFNFFGESARSLSVFIDKFNQLPADWSKTAWEYDVGLHNWINRHKIKASNLASCKHIFGYDEINGCGNFTFKSVVFPRSEDYDKNVYSCVVLDRRRFSFAHSPYINTLEISVSEQLKMADLSVMLYWDTPNMYTDSISYYEQLGSAREPDQIVQKIDLQQNYHITKADKPYHNSSCDTEQYPAHVCYDKCFIAEHNCTWYFQEGLSYHYVNGTPLALCAMGDVIYSDCENKCPRKCKTEENTYVTSYGGALLGPDRKGVIIEANHLVMTMVMAEVPLHDIGNMLSGIGGLFGLFLGGSILSIVHVVQFLGKLILQWLAYGEKY